MADVKLDDSEFQKKINKLIRDIAQNKRKKLLHRIGITAQNEIEKNFDREADIKGRSWKPLKSSTLQRRPRGRGARAPKILQDNRNLVKINYRVVGTTEIDVGTLVDYGHYHQFGQGVPKREWLYLNKKATDQIFKVAYDFFKQVIG